MTNVNPKYKNLKNRITIKFQMDEMWGRVRTKKTPCWLWHAINCANGDVIAFVLGERKNKMLTQLWHLLTTLNINIKRVYTDKNFAYEDILPPEILHQGKYYTQKIERKHLTFRTRLKRLTRKTICYSKSLPMHKIMITLLINCLEFNNHPF